jgi:hypothetical protein
MTVVAPVSGAGATGHAGADGGGGIVVSGRVVSVAPDGGGAAIWAVVDPLRPTATAGTSPVTSATPRSDWPHSMQNFCPVRTSVPHEGHCMR